MSDHRPTRTGVCVVRVETDCSAGLLITVTGRVRLDGGGESVTRTAVREVAVERVRAFLEAFEQDTT